MAKDAAQAQKFRIALIWGSVCVAVLALCILFFGGAMYAYGRMYDNKMFPGVRVLGVHLDGLTKSEAQQAVQSAADAALGKGIRFSYRGKDVSVDPAAIAANPDAGHDLIGFDIDHALDSAYQIGRDPKWQNRLLAFSHLRIASIDVPTDITIDRAALADALRSALKADVHEPANAVLAIDANAKPPVVHITPESDGTELLADDAFDALRHQAETLDFHPIALDGRSMHPTVTTKDLEPLVPKAEGFLQRPSLAFTTEKLQFPIPTSTLAGWISVTGTNGSFEVTLDQNAFAASLKTIAGSIEREGKNGGLNVKDGKIVSFTAGTDGVEIDTAATFKQVLSDWPASSTFPIITRVSPGKLVGEDPEKLGITELLGVGTSNFSGSPVNRRKNIAHGAALVNGSIIQSGETFSLLKTLGPVDGEHKWLTELVIKGNETKPEFGGGLCQIGTTTFRGALASGLPIVERQNHSYRVRYYEPAGTDATIYEPKPDFRFLNDTGHPILINAYLKGDDAFFEFWGTRDGRVTDVGKSRVYNIVAPPPMKLAETLDLAPGKKKCTETAHAGADAQFNYTVTYPNGDVKKESFQSHYRPWQAVCLVGVEKLSASSTSAELPSIDKP